MAGTVLDVMSIQDSLEETPLVSWALLDLQSPVDAKVVFFFFRSRPLSLYVDDWVIQDSRIFKRQVVIYSSANNAP